MNGSILFIDPLLQFPSTLFFVHLTLSFVHLSFQNRLNTSINFLPKCRFFWGFVFVQYDFDLLMSYGGSLEGLEGEGFRYSLTKKDLNGEVSLSFS